MQRITVKELIEFKRKTTERTKKSFSYKLKNRPAKEKTTDKVGGGDYWIISTSTIYNTFKHGKDEFYDVKIEEVRLKLENTESKRDKTTYQRNINILTSFKDFDFDDLKPSNISKFETVHKDHKVITIDNYPLYVNPSLLFCHERNGKEEIGALWLIPQLEGFKKSELGMFCEMLYRFLVKNYSADYQISEDYCIAIDTFNAQQIIYSELLEGKVPFLIDATLNEIGGS